MVAAAGVLGLMALGLCLALLRASLRRRVLDAREAGLDGASGQALRAPAPPGAWSTKLSGQSRFALQDAAQRLEGAGRLAEAVEHWTELEQFVRAAALLLKLGKFGDAAEYFRMAGENKRAIDAYLAAELYQPAIDLCIEIGDRKRAADLMGEVCAMKSEHERAARYFVDAQEF